MPADPAAVAAIALAVILAALVQGASGFGFGLVSMGVLPLFLPVPEAVAVVALWGCALNVAIGWRLRAQLRAARVLPLVAGAALGVPVGIRFLADADPDAVKGALGAVVLAYALYGLAGGIRAARRALPRWVAVAAGFVAGALGGAFGTGGPPVVVYVAAEGWDKDASTATLQAFFLFNSVVVLGGLLASGLVAPAALGADLLLLPAVAAGLYAGIRIYDRVPQEVFRKLVLGLLAALGVNYLARALV